MNHGICCLALIFLAIVVIGETIYISFLKSQHQETIDAYVKKLKMLDIQLTVAMRDRC